MVRSEVIRSLPSDTRTELAKGRLQTSEAGRARKDTESGAWPVLTGRHPWLRSLAARRMGTLAIPWPLSLLVVILCQPGHRRDLVGWIHYGGDVRELGY